MPLETEKAQGQQQPLYTPPGPPPIIFEDFSGGLNTNSTRPGIKDNELWWSDGFFPIAPNYLRTIPDVGTAIYTAGSLNPNPPSSMAVVWAVTTSCKFLPFTLTQTGDTAPLIALTADDVNVIPSTFTLFDIDVDTAGNQYLFRLATNGDESTFYSIDVYARGTVGWNPPPAKLRSIAGPSTQMDTFFGNNAQGGICVDTANTFIYVANDRTILRFPIDADGDAAGTVIATHGSGIIATRIYYDNPRSLLWLSCGQGDGALILAYDLSGTLQRTITDSTDWGPLTNLDSIAIDDAGFIYALGSDAGGNVTVYVYSPDANGNSVAVRQLHLPDGASGGGVDVDKTTGNVYFCYSEGGDVSSHIGSVPNVDGTYNEGDYLTDIAGTNTLLDFDFDDPEVVDGVQEIRIIYHYP